MGGGAGAPRPSPETRVGSFTHSPTPGGGTTHPRESENTRETASSPPAGRPQRYSPDSPAAANSGRAGSGRGSAQGRCWGLVCLRRDMARLRAPAGPRQWPTSDTRVSKFGNYAPLGRSAHVRAPLLLGAARFIPSPAGRLARSQGRGVLRGAARGLPGPTEPELVRNADSRAPPQTRGIRICILTSSPGDSHAH